VLSTARAFRTVASLLGEDQRKRLAALRSLTTPEWPAVIAAANDHLLGPTLYAEAAKKHWIQLLPEDVRDYLALQYRFNASRNGRIRSQLIECISCLNAAGIPCLLLKGAPSLTEGQDLGARIIRDVDLLIPRRYLKQAARELIGLGYHRWTGRPSGRHAFGVLARDGEPAALDLHMEIIEQRHLAPTEAFWGNCRRTEFAGVHAFVPSPERQLLHVAMHEMVHNEGYIFGCICLRALHDFSRIASQLPGECWPALHEDLTRRKAIVPFAAMAYAAERLLGCHLWAPAAGLASRVFYIRAALQQHRLLPAGMNRVWMYGYKALARHYFDPARDKPPMIIWRMRRIGYLSSRAARLWLTGSTEVQPGQQPPR
jgi:hypothetical protein